jgi:DNA-binding transcriptional regulator YhcF (GntR family)
LGLKLETVSRTLSKLAGERIIAIHRRQIDIINPAGLQRIVNAAASR